MSLDIHRLDNVLSAIIGCANLALEDLEEGHPATAMVEKARQAAYRALEITADASPQPSTASPVLSIVPARRRILVADDQPSMLEYMRDLLERAGYAVETVSNGREAVASIRDSRPDLLITDIVMPEQEGIETILELRGIAPELPVIAMSAGGRRSSSFPDHYLRAAEGLGAARVFSKPIDQPALLTAIEELLA